MSHTRKCDLQCYLSLNKQKAIIKHTGWLFVCKCGGRSQHAWKQHGGNSEDCAHLCRHEAWPPSEPTPRGGCWDRAEQEVQAHPALGHGTFPFWELLSPLTHLSQNESLLPQLQMIILTRSCFDLETLGEEVRKPNELQNHDHVTGLKKEVQNVDVTWSKLKPFSCHVNQDNEDS